MRERLHRRERRTRGVWVIFAPSAFAKASAGHFRFAKVGAGARDPR
jgi:hypothetical protein